MRSWGKSIWILLFLLPLVFTACWIPLPRDTAIVVQVLEGADPTGIPIEGAAVLIDGQASITREDGTAFQSLSLGGSYPVQVDAESLLDPQGGRAWTLLGSQISGESPEGTYVAYADRGYAIGDTAMTVPVEEGFITVVTVYVSPLLASPEDNQWLTDGRDASSPYRSANIDEFASTILPTFWWRQEPSLIGTGIINMTFQMWQDIDGDTRFPMGVEDPLDYDEVMDPASSFYIPPDWQVPLAGLQTAVPGSTSEVFLLSGAAVDSSSVSYDVYYAQTPSWNNNQWENNNIIRNIPVVSDGGAVRSNLSFSTPGFTAKNGVQYTFGLRAQDASANLDTLMATNTSNTTPVSGNSPLGSVTGFAIIGTAPGQVIFTFNGRGVATSYRFYAGPNANTVYNEKYVRKIFSDNGPSVIESLGGLVGGTNYYFGVEPFGANNDVGVAGSPLLAVPGTPISDTTAPAWITTSFSVSPAATPGDVDVTWGTATDASPFFYRLYIAPGSVSASDAAAAASGLYGFIDTSSTSATFRGLVNAVSYNILAVALDDQGNRSTPLGDSIVLSDPADTTGPVWTTEDSAIFTSVNWSSGSTVYPLGWTYDYNGFALRQDPRAAPPQGEYVWRVIQDNGTAPPVESKLGAFYTYDGYYYWSGESGALKMTSPSSNVDHRRFFTFLELGLPPIDQPSEIMTTPLDASLALDRSYQQRPAADFTGLQSSNTITDPDWVNQMIIRYDTNADGEATNLGNGAYLRSRLMNRQTSLTLDPPYLRNKGFFLTYLDRPTDDLVPFLPPAVTGPVLFFGLLSDPDFEAPVLAP